ncbi:RidA family protein [Cedecea lapagei]|uniref:RidA family protein n=1 Tax=Cedecea lapagei TaxID=158823 RepID=UPI001BCBBE02|nr:RidA family protein [Cedecea lapagei]
MSDVYSRLTGQGWSLPPALVPPPGVVFPFEAVRIVGNRAYISGHGPQNPDGSLYAPRGKVGGEVSEQEACEAARLTALSILGSLHRSLGDLNRISSWNRVFGMVNAAPGFTRLPAVINGFSQVILTVFGPDVGAHSRSAVGLAELPFDIAVEIEGEVGID